MGQSTMSDTIFGQDYLFFSDFGRRNKQSCQLGNVCRVICYEFDGLGRVLKCMVFNITFSLRYAYDKVGALVYGV
jgi:hypothetical protein